MLCLVLVQPAFGAPQCKSLPGRSGLDQYCESIPGATGDRSPGSESGTGRDVSTATRQRLERSGPAGRALLGLIGSPAGDRAASDSNSDGGSSGGSDGNGDGGGSSGGSSAGGGTASGGSSRSPGDKAADEPSNDVFSAVRSAADSGATAGRGFVWVLAAVVLLLVGAAWVRYRLRGPAE